MERVSATRGEHMQTVELLCSLFAALGHGGGAAVLKSGMPASPLVGRLHMVSWRLARLAAFLARLIALSITGRGFRVSHMGSLVLCLASLV